MRENARIGFVTIYLLATTLALSRCAPHTSCSLLLPLAASQVRLAYPIAGATGVPADLGTLVFFNGDAGTPIELSQAGKIVQTTATAVPSALPTPNSTPYPGTTPFARHVSTLDAGTMYDVKAYYDRPASTGPCGYPGISGYTTIGSFTTQ